MSTEWFETVKAELLSANPFRESEYFKRFAAGGLSREQAWGHVSQWYFLICWFPRMFSGIHSRCDVLEVRKDCARHLLVEDLGYFRGRIGGTPDHVELYQRIGDDMGYARDAWEGLQPMPEMRDILAYFRRLAHEIPWSASLCTTAFIEAEVVEISRTVGRALAGHYGCRPEWGAMNYLVHEEVEREEAGETEGAILKYIETAEDRWAAGQSMREMHRLLDAYAKGLARDFLPART
jgi:pyrroloquinoline-quinone synthase